MHKLVKNLRKLARDERGGEVMEYALILGLIVVAAAAVITTVGSKVLANWKSVKKAVK
jgi:Flp pilus assembly pilin Flp